MIKTLRTAEIVGLSVMQLKKKSDRSDAKSFF